MGCRKIQRDGMNNTPSAIIWHEREREGAAELVIN